MKLTDLWPLANAAERALGRRIWPAMDAATADLPEGSGIVLLPAATFAPDPISPSRLRVRSPYTAPQIYAAWLAAAAEAGLFEPLGDDRYALTDLGWQRVQEAVGAAYRVMADLAPLPPAKLEDLAALLHRLVLASLFADEPAGKWSIVHSRRLDPTELSQPVIRIDQYLSDLNAFRDDAHLASWKPYGVPGQAWEALTLLWRGAMDDLTALHEKLRRRGYDVADYQTALGELVERSWLTATGNRYRLTDKGQALRQLAEEETDRLFFTPWACLSTGELADLGALLTGFRDALEVA